MVSIAVYTYAESAEVAYSYKASFAGAIYKNVNHWVAITTNFDRQGD